MRHRAAGHYGRSFRLAAAALALALAALLLVSCDHGPRRLGAHSERYRYALRNAIPVTDRPIANFPTDLDGDGIDEEIKFDGSYGGSSYMMAARVGEDRYYALFSRNFMTTAGICGVADVTGDGVADVVWWEQPRRDRMRISISRLDVDGAAARDSTLASIEWSPEGQLLPDGSWGAGMPLLAAFDSDLDGTADVLAIGMCAGIVKRPRGVWFWDVDENEFAARVATAGTPSGPARTGDIDADGRDELVVGFGAPGNAVKVGEWDDSHSYVMAFEGDGAVLWWHEMGGYSSDVDLLIEDLDGDGALEVVACVGGHAEQDPESFRVSVLRGADGELLTEIPLGCSVNAVESMACEGGRRFFVGASDGLLRRFRWDGTSISLEGQLDCGDAVEGIRVMRLGPSPAPERLVVGMVKGGVAVLDGEMSPLAYMDTGETIYTRNTSMRATGVSLRGRPEPALFLLTQSKAMRLHLVKRPLPFWMRVVLPMAAVMAALGLVPRTRRVAVARLRRWLLPRARRGEATDALLAALAAASHGKLAATSTLRRMREQLRMLQNYEGEPPSVFRERFEKAVSDVGQVGAPGVRGIADQAERLGIAPLQAGPLRHSVVKIERVLGALPHGLPSRTGAAELGRLLDGLLPGVESSLLAIRQAARLERSCDPEVELDRSLAARASEFGELGADVTIEGRKVLSGLRVCGTPGELSFVLENLLGNAAEAMKKQERREVRVTARIDADRLVLLVSDTGKGIREEDRARIFMGGFSSKPSGGGRGLSLSREMLARRDGSIELVESRPGCGAAFEVRTVICQGGEAD